MMRKKDWCTAATAVGVIVICALPLPLVPMLVVVTIGTAAVLAFTAWKASA